MRGDYFWAFTGIEKAGKATLQVIRSTTIPLILMTLAVMAM